MVRISPKIQWTWSQTSSMFGLASGGRFQPLWGQKANFWYIWATENLFTCKMIRISPGIQWTWPLVYVMFCLASGGRFQPLWGQKGNFSYILATEKLFTCKMVKISPGIQWKWSWICDLFGLASGGQFLWEKDDLEDKLNELKIPIRAWGVWPEIMIQYVFSLKDL